ncbi:MAG TPA: tRNA (guanosine(37)-N1)-methyltransferase TrmD [Candidatus Binatia bacterium]|nr:tRNA (guanosine(37)-N1)-methyltransferase TrmD [Candidatus Binatia bacterium]
MLRFAVITIFPELLKSALQHGILRRAREKELIQVQMVDLRDYTTDRHRTTDDTPYGGGQGMVMKPEPLVAAIEELRGRLPGARVILLSPRGKVFNQAEALRLAREKALVLVCGRYEGIDERVHAFVDEEISIGDYVLSGGEPAAHVIIDTVARLIPGALGNEDSAREESFVDGLLEGPQYTRPEDFRGLKVPPVLISGDHQRIEEWRRQKSIEITRERRPDLLAKSALSAAEKARLDAIRAPVYLALLHHPVYDKNGQVVTTAVTNMDIHDIARSGRTYGVRGFYVVTPVKALQKLSRKIIEHWETGYGSEYNATRKEALALARILDTLDDAIIAVERECGVKPVLVATSARPTGKRTSFEAMRDMLKRDTRPVLILFGTGWGLTEAVLLQSDFVLEAIAGRGDYNHLSVRSAAAIVLDRLLGRG